MLFYQPPVWTNQHSGLHKPALQLRQHTHSTHTSVELSQRDERICIAGDTIPLLKYGDTEPRLDKISGGNESIRRSNRKRALSIGQFLNYASHPVHYQLSSQVTTGDRKSRSGAKEERRDTGDTDMM
uniref:ARAD1A05742p n=1 Tax=Blastobotrys adeninivorans TaxID=409370 RepID=A0A060T318_BLAAD